MVNEWRDTKFYYTFSTSSDKLTSGVYAGTLMPTRRGLYLTWDKASKYLATIGVHNVELSGLQYRKVNGGQKQQLIIYLADDVLQLARWLKQGHPLPSLEKFLTRSQKSRHLSEQAKRKETLAYNPLREDMVGRLNPVTLQKALSEVDDDDRDIAETLTELKRSRC